MTNKVLTGVNGSYFFFDEAPSNIHAVVKIKAANPGKKRKSFQKDIFISWEELVQVVFDGFVKAKIKNAVDEMTVEDIMELFKTAT